jgi:hypothetical protein
MTITLTMIIMIIIFALILYNLYFSLICINTNDFFL